MNAAQIARAVVQQRNHALSLKLYGISDNRRPPAKGTSRPLTLLLRSRRNGRPTNAARSTGLREPAGDENAPFSAPAETQRGGMSNQV